MATFNVPAGLTPVFNRNSDTQVTLTHNRRAGLHNDEQDTKSLILRFDDGAFADTPLAAQVTGSLRGDIRVHFNNPVYLDYSGSLIEAPANDGSVDGQIAISLVGDLFASDVVSGTRVVASNVPIGLTAVFVRTSDTQVTLALTGAATNHVDSNDISNLTVSFSDGAFVATTLASDVSNNTNSAIDIDFNNVANLIYSGSFAETNANDGTVTGTVVVTLSNDTFSGDIVSNDHVRVFNLPPGLSALLNRDSNTQISLTLVGTATAHENINDVTNLALVFSDAAFAINNAASISNSANSTIGIDFNDGLALSYQGSFVEAPSNPGAVTGTVAITLAGDTFSSDVVTSRISLVNLPAGLSANLVRDGDNIISLTLSGVATLHRNIDDVDNLTIFFPDRTFAASLASDVAGSRQNDLVIDFFDPNTDSDGDGLPDRLEIEIGSDPFDANFPLVNGGNDSDGDGVSNGVEAYLERLNVPNVDTNSDFDRDGIPDVRKVALGGVPFVADEQDSDGISDAIEAYQ